MSAKRIWILIASVVILGALTVVTVMANPFSQASSEDGVVTVEWKGVVDTVIGDDPDENGYTGPVINSSGVEVLSEGTNDLETLPAQPGDEGEIRPDENQLQALEAEPQWSDLHYDFYAGETMRPRSSTTKFDYGNSGCICRTEGRDLFNIPLILPHASRIDYLRIYYYDTSDTKDVKAWIVRFDGAGHFEDIILVTSNSSAGFGYRDSNYVGHTVDNVNYAYVLMVDFEATNVNNSLCGLRVAYRTS
ncbi:MAG TPA: hypothetical protein PK137_08615 [Anaerolineaceae bacterium]|nr:hypothetical protein [Anaerolineaceae bacterium]